MRFNLLLDHEWDSKVDQVLHALDDLGYRDYFSQRDYGSGLAGVTVVFMCRDPDLIFKRRIRMDKKEKKLYMDLMLDLPSMKDADRATRQRHMIDRLDKEVPEVLAKYKLEDFDKARFIADLGEWLAATGWREQTV